MSRSTENESTVDIVTPTVDETEAKIQTKKEKAKRGYYSLSDRLTKRFDEHVIAKRDRELAAINSRSTAQVILKNPIVRTLTRGLDYLKCLSMNFYGTIGTVFGIYVILIYLLKLYALPQYQAVTSHPILGVVLVLLFLPLVFSHKPIANLVHANKLMSIIFYDLFGLPDIGNDPEAKKGIGSIAFLIGTLLGGIAFFVSPFVIVGVLLAVVYFLISLYSPEFCFTTTLIALPFMTLFTERPTIFLCLLVCLCTVSFVIKVVLMKRVFHIELIDLFVLAFGVVYLISGVVSATKGADFAPTLAFLCLSVGGYFIASSLIKGDISIRRIVRALIFSSVIVSSIGLIEQFFGITINSWVDRDLFPDITGRITSTFDNPNVLGEFLIVTVPFSICSFFISHRFTGKFFAIIAFALSVASAIYTWSRGTWVSLVVCCAVFAVVVNRRAIFGIIALSLLAPASLFVLPNSIVDRFLSSFNTLDSSIAYRIQIWKSSADMALDNIFLGIGPGSEAFGKVYPEYAASGAEVAEHSHNLVLQIIIESGIFSLIIFAAIMAVFFVASIEYRRIDNTRSFRFLYAAGFSILVSLCVFGITEHVWYDHRMLFLFWVTLGFCSSLRNWYRERLAIIASEPLSPFSYAVDIPIKEENKK